jgi:hypothetical protein
LIKTKTFVYIPIGEKLLQDPICKPFKLDFYMEIRFIWEYRSENTVGFPKFAKPIKCDQIGRIFAHWVILWAV